jgi:hypothetical protein
MAELNENTQVKANMAFAIKVIMAVGTAVWGYSVIEHRISDVENEIVRMQSDLMQNSEFRVKWPRGEMGALPDDAEQNLRLSYIEEQIKILSAHVDQLRHASKESN